MAQNVTPLFNTLDHLFDKHKSAAVDFTVYSLDNISPHWLSKTIFPKFNELDLDLLHLIYFYAEYSSKRTDNIYDPYLQTKEMLDALSKKNDALSEAIKNKQTADAELIKLLCLAIFDDVAQQKFATTDDKKNQLKIIKKNINQLFERYYNYDCLIINKNTYEKIAKKIQLPETALFASKEEYNQDYFKITGLTPEFKKIIKRKKLLKAIIKTNLSALAKVFALGTALTLSVLIAPHISLPFIAVLLLIGYGTYKTNYKFYLYDGYAVCKDLFINKLSDLSTAQKVGFGVLSTICCSVAGLAMGAFSWKLLITGLVLLGLSHAFPPIGLTILAALITVAIVTMTALLMMKAAKRLVTSAWYKEKYEKLKNIWTVDPTLKLPAKIWGYIKAVLITAAFLGGAALGASGVAIAYAQHWFQAFLAPIHWLVTHIAPHFQHADILTKIGASIFGYGLAAPIKLVFNSDYAAALFSELGKKVISLMEKAYDSSHSFAASFHSPAAFKNAIVGLAEKIMDPIQKLDKISFYAACVTIRNFISKVASLLFGISNVFAKLTLAGNNHLAQTATGSHEGSKALENEKMSLVNKHTRGEKIDGVPKQTTEATTQNDRKPLSMFFNNPSKVKAPKAPQPFFTARYVACF